MKMLKLKKEPNLLAKHQAFPYQTEAFLAIKDLEYAAVFHEQGLGKTKIAVDLILYWIGHTDIDTVIVVTKKLLIKNWQNEFSNHTYIRPMILTCNKNENFYVFTSPSRVVLMNFETVQTEKERLKLYLKTRNVAIIIDESAKLKNPKSKLTETFHALATCFKKRVIMTGTPVANRPYDIWSQIFFLDQGKSLGSNFIVFKERTDLTNDLDDTLGKREAFEDEVSEIFSKIKQFSVRETKNSGIISLPEKVYYREKITLAETQRLLYEKIRNELIVEVKKKGHIISDDSSAAIKRLLRLVQVVSNPKLIDESYCGDSSKELYLDKLLEKILSKDEKCIVWTSFIENVEYFYKKYSSLPAVKVHGGMKIIDRNRSIDKFKQGISPVLFATPSSAKEGLTLTIANHVIFYDRSFSLDDYLQAQDRIHRISQKKTCYIHNLIAEDSIDEWIDSLLDIKQQAALMAQGDISKQHFRDVADYSYGALVRLILFPDKQGETNAND